MGGPSRNNDPNWMSAFTSGDAHNGCRALFNGTAGWAYFGPAGEIDEGALPAGTVSYPYNVKGDKSGLFGMAASGSGSGVGGGGASQAAKKPGDDLNRKSNEMRGVYFDAKDLAHLVRGWAGDDDDDDDDDDDAVQNGGGYCERGGGEEEEEGRPRKGRPIVLTLQAILAATTPTAAAAVVAADAVAAFPLNAKAAAAATEEETATDKDGNNYTAAAAAMPAAAAAVAGVTAAENNAQFPPLMLRDASAEKGPGLYLAPPITMVKKNGPGHPAEQLAASHEAAAAGTQGCAVSCSEAAAATSVAEAAVLAAAAAGDETAADGAAAAAATTGGGGGGAVSRIGWWLRWATSGSGEGEVSPAAEAAGGDGLETRSGADGWEVVVSSAPAAAGVAANAPDGAAHERRRRGGGGGGGGNDEVASWSDFAGGEDKADTRFGKDDGDDDATAAAPQSVSPNVPRSFRDTLMAGAAAGFSDPKAFSRSRAAAAVSSSSSGAASSPTLVDGGEQGGAVFLWRKAAAGQGGRAADRAKSMLEDEDPYYARKRVGAFAHRTKPRGKAHK